MPSAPSAKSFQDQTNKILLYHARTDSTTTVTKRKDTPFPSGEWLFSLSKSHESSPILLTWKVGIELAITGSPKMNAMFSLRWHLPVPITGVRGFLINQKNSPEGDLPPWAKIGWAAPIGQGRKGADRSGVLVHSSSFSPWLSSISLSPDMASFFLFLLYLTPFWGLGLSLGLVDTREQPNTSSAPVLLIDFKKTYMIGKCGISSFKGGILCQVILFLLVSNLLWNSLNI